MGISRKTTFALASIALAITLVVAVVNEDRTVFSYVLFAWSGIAATFCPVVILSLFWPRMTARGALAAMLVGLVSVPIFKFVAPGFAAPLGPFFASLGELPPSFLAALIAGIGVSLQDKRGLTELRGVQAELDDAGA
jgi:Na+/proline symporter